MRSHSAVLCVLVAALACDSAPEVSEPVEQPSMSAPAEAAPVMHGHGIGCLTIGTAVAALPATCQVLQDTVVLGIEGMLERRVTVGVSGAELLATVVSDTIWRIMVETPRIRTDDSLGVGTTLAHLMALPDMVTIEGEGGIFMVGGDHCGLSFELAASRSDVPGAGSLDAVIRALDPETPVSRVLIVGCDQS